MDMGGWESSRMRPRPVATGVAKFQPLGRSSKPIYRYSSSNVDKYLASHCGGSVRSSISAKKLAEAILVSVPEGLAAACSGAASVETLEWLQDLERALNQGYLPKPSRNTRRTTAAGR